MRGDSRKSKTPNGLQNIFTLPAAVKKGGINGSKERDKKTPVREQLDKYAKMSETQE
jgi:hypothetical protein